MRKRRRHQPLAIPAQPNPLIGREGELAALLALLGAPDVRLVTVTGPAGAGKTRLAVAAAARLVEAPLDGLWFVDLAPIHDPRLVLTAIGRAAAVREARGELAETGLERHIGERRILLLLDNFEQVLPAASGLAELLAACPNLKILATSRAPLRLRWEHVLPVLPLAVPELTSLPQVDALGGIDAVALFVQRARRVAPEFALTAANARAVAEICVRLDGLPLAIELAAARSDVYQPAEVLTRLRRTFELLAGGAADLPPRQQSLEAAFDWGYELLSPPDQAVFRRLGVFVAGFTPEAALAVAGADLTTLVQHSLVRRETGDEPRFRMLETLRAYALERLERSGEHGATFARHARVMLDLAERAAPELLGAHQADWLARLEREHNDLAASLRWTVAAGELELSLRLAGALWRFWWLHGHLSEGTQLLDAVLDATREAPPQLLGGRAAVLNGAGVLAHVRGEYERAATLLSESFGVARAIGSTSTMAASLHNLGALARERGDWTRAQQAYEDSLSIEREASNKWGIATSLVNLGALAEDRGETQRAAALLDEGLALLREIGDERGIAAALDNLAAVARAAGDWRRAADLHEQSLARWRKLGDRWGTAAALTDLARVIERSGDWHRAALLFGESLTLFAEVGVRQPTAACFEGFAAVLCDVGREADAARLLGAAEALREEIGAPLPSRDRRDAAHLVARARGRLSAAAFRAAWQAGRALSGEAGAAEALRLVATVIETQPPPTEASQSGLTARQREVVALIASGLSNRQIAERLVISERTADRHVSNILGRLGLNSRAQVAALAVESRMGTVDGPLYP